MMMMMMIIIIIIIIDSMVMISKILGFYGYVTVMCFLKRF
jgi:hypothetical protein